MRWTEVAVAAGLYAGCDFYTNSGTIDGAGSADAKIFKDAAFDPAVCPPGYTVTIAATSYRYRIITTNGTFWDHDSMCKSDKPGFTHLAAFGSDTEAMQIGALLGQQPQPPPMSFYFVGAVQDMNQATPAAGWHWEIGGAVATSWATGDPDDLSGTETNKENLAVVTPDGALHDVFEQHDTGHVEGGAVCECDGRPFDPAVVSQIQPDPT